MTVRGPVLTLKEAARIDGAASLSTIRRRLPELEALGAARSASGWQIPIAALHQLGLIPGVTPPRGSTTPQTTPPAETPVEPSEIEALKREVEELRRRAEVAEARAEERGNALADARMALRAIEARVSTSDAPGGSTTPQVKPPADAPKKQSRWWLRGKKAS